MLNLQNIETDSLAQRTAFTNSDDVTVLDTDESWGAMGRNVFMSLLITVVLLNIVEVFTSNDNGSFHLGADNVASQDTSTDGDVTGEWTLLVNKSTTDGLLWGLETKTNILVPTGTLSIRNDTLVIEEDSLLLLETTMDLFRHT